MKYKSLIRNGFDKPICAFRVIPEIKTISAYENALEDAMEALFKERNESNVLKILSDAKEHGKWPKKYRSLGTESFYIGNVHVIKAHFSLKRLEISIRTHSHNITIEIENINVTGGVITESAFWKEIESFQQILQKISKINN